MPERGEVVCWNEPLVKTQRVRLLDVFLIGPLMVYGAAKMPRGPAAAVLAFFGVSTVLYNARNYLLVEEWEEQ
ncbi:hypothetical protein CMI37_19145 [Candidatus Pacearchaeota archaeon]|nr:hypothetical protein [Candidatus Pacearchaeota archaeon]|tara:strand:+ start:621 stop:839 length:219 start_codon:yes stop_codon:yes gene_type:complete